MGVRKLLIVIAILSSIIALIINKFKLLDINIELLYTASLVIITTSLSLVIIISLMYEYHPRRR